MQAVFRFAAASSCSLSLFLGLSVIVVAGVVATTSYGLGDITGWALKVFGGAFLALLSALVFLVFFCWARMGDAHRRGRNADAALWLETGLHASNGVSTLALTFTLLGISLGIGSLANQELTPETVQVVIRGLTKHFSLAFMTTVVGLPMAALLRALMSITHHTQQIVD
jgi:hypothetical protein